MEYLGTDGYGGDKFKGNGEFPINNIRETEETNWGKSEEASRKGLCASTFF
jgi:hypothetical protein